MLEWKIPPQHQQAAKVEPKAQAVGREGVVESIASVLKRHHLIVVAVDNRIALRIDNKRGAPGWPPNVSRVKKGYSSQEVVLNWQKRQQRHAELQVLKHGPCARQRAIIRPTKRERTADEKQTTVAAGRNAGGQLVRQRDARDGVGDHETDRHVLAIVTKKERPGQVADVLAGTQPGARARHRRREPPLRGVADQRRVERGVLCAAYIRILRLLRQEAKLNDILTDEIEVCAKLQP